jgi:hypothetical protein
MYDFSSRMGGLGYFRRPHPERFIIEDNDLGYESYSAPEVNKAPDYLPDS